MSAEANPVLDKLMEQHLARMGQLQDQGIQVTKKWTEATTQLVERFVDVQDKISPVLLAPPTAETRGEQPSA